MLLHALNAALVFALLQQMTGATWRSLFVAALFAVHPLRVESVAWVAERKDVLSGCFGLLALIAYARYVQVQSLKSKVQSQEPESRNPPHAPLAKPRSAAPSSTFGVQSSRFYVRPSPPDFLPYLAPSIFYLLSLCFFALGLMSKPMLVTWPFVMLLLDYWPLRRFELSTPNSQLSTIVRLVKEKIPFFALAVAASVVTFMVQKHGGAMAVVEWLPLGARGGNALISYCRYLGKLFWPTDLAVLYPHPGYWPLAKVLLAGGLILGITVFLVVKRRRYPFLLIGWLWFVGTLVPVIGLVQTGAQAMADRYTYIPSLGVLVFAIWGAYELTRRWHYGVIALSVAVGAAIALCMVLTRQQLAHWRNSEALFRHAIEVTENNCLAHVKLGIALNKKGQTDEAISQHQEAIRLKPDFAEAHSNLGIALDKKGRTDEAIHQYQEAIRLKPDDANAYYNLGIALAKKGQADEAIRQYQEAIRLKPDFAQAHNNLGYLWAEHGENLDQARAVIEKAVKLEPKNAAFLDSMGWVLLKLNRPREALDYLLKAIENSNQPDASIYDHLGDTYAALNQREKAAEAWRKSQSVEPSPQIQKKLDWSAH